MAELKKVIFEAEVVRNVPSPNLCGAMNRCQWTVSTSHRILYLHLLWGCNYCILAFIKPGLRERRETCCVRL